MKTIIYSTTLIFLLVSSVMAEVTPTAKQVDKVSIKFKHTKQGDVEFNATADDWEAIRANLLPAQYDPNPSKWEWLGTVKILKKDGNAYHIELYSTSSGPGAFAAGETYDKRKYYRGGKTTAVLKSLLTAYEKSNGKPRKK